MKKRIEKTAIELTIEKLQADLQTTTKMATAAIKENRKLLKELQRLTTRINTNESNIGHLSSKR